MSSYAAEIKPVSPGIAWDPLTGSLDLATLREVYRARTHTPEDIVKAVFDRIGACGDDAVWIGRFSREEVLGCARILQALAPADDPFQKYPLYGVPFAVKDNIDVKGLKTTAACPAFAYEPFRSATVVDRLVNAGALVIGKTNLDQFAVGLVGARSPYGSCKNPFDGR